MPKQIGIKLSAREVRIFLNGGFTNGGAYYGSAKYTGWDQQNRQGLIQTCQCSDCNSNPVPANCVTFCNTDGNGC